MSLAAGPRLAHYEIIEPIGKGAMAETKRSFLTSTLTSRNVTPRLFDNELFFVLDYRF